MQEQSIIVHTKHKLYYYTKTFSYELIFMLNPAILPHLTCHGDLTSTELFAAHPIEFKFT